MAFTGIPAPRDVEREWVRARTAPSSPTAVGGIREVSSSRTFVAQKRVPTWVWWAGGAVVLYLAWRAL